MEPANRQNLYEVLEVRSDAPQEEIHQAFIRAKQTYSPTSPALYSVFTPEEAKQLLKLIDDAYAVLGNPVKRREYDSLLISGESPNAEDVLKKDHKKGADVTTKSTSFGHYTVNEQMEEEIRTQEVFDGTFLKKIRSYKQITVDQLSTSTRIGRHYIEAIEANEFHALPAAVFVRGFIQQISRILGLDAQKTTSSYIKLFNESQGS